MSTDNIQEQAEAARRALGELASATRKRRTIVEHAREGLQRERDNIVIGGRAAMRNIDDEDALFEEELGQLTDILNITPVVSPAGAVLPTPGTVNRLFTVDELNALSNEDLTRLVAAYDYDEFVVENGNRQGVVIWLVAMQARYCQDHGLADPNAAVPAPTAPTPAVVVQTRRFDLNPMSWGWVQWLTAVVGAIIAYSVANYTRHFPDYSGFPRGLFAFAWVVVVTAVGFFAGGLIGWWITHRHDED